MFLYFFSSLLSVYFAKPGYYNMTFLCLLLGLPVLFQQSVADIVAEGNMFIFNIEAISGFPLVPSSFQWYFSGEVLQDSSLINITSYPNITINSVHRNNSGNYSLSVSNEAGTTTGFFILDVQCKNVINA